jgi:hypothetical protein
LRIVQTLAEGEGGLVDVDLSLLVVVLVLEHVMLRVVDVVVVYQHPSPHYDAAQSPAACNTLLILPCVPCQSFLQVVWEQNLLVASWQFPMA